MSDAARVGAATTISVRVRLFAIQRELAGTKALDLDVPPDASVADAWSALVGRYPALAPGGPYVRYAVNGAYAAPDRALADGDELAVIPPVSGGAPEADADVDAGTAGRTAAVRILELHAEPFAPDLVTGLVRRLAVPADGAVVTFLGVTRESPGTPAPGQAAEVAEAERHAGRRVHHLEYEAFEPLALAVLEAIADEIAERFGVVRLAIVHRTGPVPLGEVSVAIVASAPHRGPAFDAVRYAIEETKARAPIWKAEHFEDGHVWVGAPAREGPR